jgi:AcrR family transcriptional regulator
MSAHIKLRSPRDRILATALDLFYRQGYAATGINQIISEAGVARASFYDHFDSKEALLVAYALEISRKEISEIRALTQGFATPEARFYAPLDTLIPWFETSDFRGCPFQNLMAEVPPNAKAVQEVARHHAEACEAFFEELAFDLKNSSSRFAHIDPKEIAKEYLIIFNGAIATAVACRDTWPVANARKTLHCLVAPH